jgi:hypothetical protein
MHIVTPITNGKTDQSALRDGSGDLLGFMESCAIADEVVRRVNAHDVLVAAVKEGRSWLPDDEHASGARARLDAALLAAKGTP